MSLFEHDSQSVILTPDQRLRVFISSTLQELADERVAVRRAVEKLRLIPIFFEAGARPHPARDLYRAYLEQSHIFIGLYWERYGWVAPDMDISGLEDEYRLSEELPRLIYLKTPSPDREPGLKGLLARIKNDGISYKYFQTADELEELVENDLAVLLSERFAQADLGRPVAKSLDPSSSRLPVETSRFFGRRAELEALENWLADPDKRLVTLTGPGGVGKTRLALKTASVVADAFPQGVYYVELAAVRDSLQAPAAIARAISLQEVAGQPLLESLKIFFRNRRALLVLDNFEQIIPAAQMVIELLGAAPYLKVLVTSRELLRVRGEFEFPVTTLTVPAVEANSLDEIQKSEAVQLFADRSQGNQGAILTQETAPLVAEITRRLDGLPLAIELAAARSRLLPPKALLSRLDDRLALLSRGAQDMPSRQQTLRSTIDWSYQLLTPEEQRLFARLAVFHSGWTLEAAEQVCTTDDLTGVLDKLESLFNKSLIVREVDFRGEPRFRFLETIREYAQERFHSSQEKEAIRQKHAVYYFEFSEKAGMKLYTGESPEWMERLNREVENLRAMFDWALEKPERSSYGLELTISLSWFWYLRGQLSEGQEWLQHVLDTLPADRTPGYGIVLANAGIMANWVGDLERAEYLLKQAEEILESGADRWLYALSMMQVGVTRINQGRESEVRQRLLKSLEIFRETENFFYTGTTLMHLGNVELGEGDPSSAQKWLQESRAIAQKLGNQWLMASALNNLGEVARFRGDYSAAGNFYAESEKLFCEADAVGDRARVIHNLGIIAHYQGDRAQGIKRLGESLETFLQVGIRRGVAECLAGYAGLEAELGRPENSARLLCYAQALMRALNMAWWPADRARILQLEQDLLQALGDEGYQCELDTSRGLALDEVLRLVDYDLQVN